MQLITRAILNRLPPLALVILCSCTPLEPERDAGATDAMPDAASADASMDAETPDASDAADADVADAGPAPTRVLFVGNSFTYQHDLPDVIRALAATTGADLEVESVTEGGATICDHWMAGLAGERIAEGGFDSVVLQGQSFEPLLAGTSFAFGYYGDMFGELVTSVGSRSVWFSTWPRRPGHPDYELYGYTFESMTWRVEGAYRTRAWNADGFLARVGSGWQIALEELPEVELWAEDGRHASAAGALLSACVLSQAITGEAPIVSDPVPLDVPLETARDLCAIAPRVACPMSYSLCDGTCVSLTQDPLHCGACGNECSVEEPCRSGVCGCPETQTACSRRCTNLEVDERNCGACRNTCDPGAECNAGACECLELDSFNANYTTLATFDPGCVDGTPASEVACSRAAHLYCESLSCFSTGMGPRLVPGEGQAITCVVEDLVPTTFTTLSTLERDCDGVVARGGRACSTAAHEYCVARGEVSGFGPVLSAGDDASVVCLSTGLVEDTSFIELSTLFARCDGVGTVWGFDCSIAASFLCRDRGHGLNALGPFVVDGGVQVVCLDE